MKTPEDEAWEEMERRQGAGGFPAKRAMAADKMHWSDCAVHNGPAYPAGPCDCGPTQPADNPYGYDWSMLEAAQESLREHMARIKELEAQLAQPAQEPVAWVCEGCASDEKHAIDYWQEDVDDIPIGTLLYAAPPQRPWVGLTGDELADLWYKESLDWMEFARAHEAALKEKNNG
jgi:hypothetical protein